MKIARFRVERRTAYGVVMGDEVVEIRGSIYTRFRLTATRHPLSGVKLLPPTDPSSMWAPGANSAAATGGNGASMRERPEPWHKGRNALTGHKDPIVIPRDSAGDVHCRGEAVAVIGKNCRRIAPAQAPRMILGYACGNEVCDKTWQGKDATFWRARGADTFAPVGPWIETDLDPQDLEIAVSVNGGVARRSHTGDMAFSFAEIVSYISQQVTLPPRRPGVLRRRRGDPRHQARRRGDGQHTRHRRPFQPRSRGIRRRGVVTLPVFPAFAGMGDGLPSFPSPYAPFTTPSIVPGGSGRQPQGFPPSFFDGAGPRERRRQALRGGGLNVAFPHHVPPVGPPPAGPIPPPPCPLPGPWAGSRLQAQFRQAQGGWTGPWLPSRKRRGRLPPPGLPPAPGLCRLARSRRCRSLKRRRPPGPGRPGTSPVWWTRRRGRRCWV